MRRQAGTRTDPDALEGVAPLIGDIAAGSPGGPGRGARQERAGFAGGSAACPRMLDSMPVRLHHIVVDAHDLPGLARFWTQALGWKVLSEREREIVIGTDEHAPVGMCFMPHRSQDGQEPRAPGPDQQRAGPRPGDREAARAGARRAGIGQVGEESWTVLADPEGNTHPVRLNVGRRRSTGLRSEPWAGIRLVTAREMNVWPMPGCRRPADCDRVVALRGVSTGRFPPTPYFRRCTTVVSVWAGSGVGSP
jgi:hypothetical protein